MSRLIRVFLAAFCAIVTGFTPVTGYAGDEPHEALMSAVQALRDNDIRGLVEVTVGEEEFKKLAAEWTEERENQLAKITDEDRAQFAAQMEILTVDGAEDFLMELLGPQLEIWKTQSAQFVPMIEGLGALQIEQIEGVTEEDSQELNQLLQAFVAWVQAVDIASPDLARQAVGVATRTARELDIAALDDLMNLEFNQVLDKFGITLGGVRDILSIYGLSIDETLDSYNAETIANDGSTATVKNTFTLLGAPLEIETEYVLVDENWLSKDAIEQSQKVAALAEVMAAAEQADAGASQEDQSGSQGDTLPAEQVYLEYRAVLESAGSYEEIAQYWSTRVTESEPLQSPDVRAQELQILKNYATDVRVIGYSAYTADATLYTEGVDADGNDISGQVLVIDDGDGWKIDEIEWSEPAAVEAQGSEVDMGLYDGVLYMDAPMVKDMLDKGGDPNFVQYGSGMLASAAQTGSVEIVEALINAGADLNAVNSIGQTPLMRALELQHEEVARVLIAAGSDLEIVNDYGQTVAMVASELGQPGLVRALIEAGADFNIVDSDGNTPILRVVQGYGENMHEIIALLGEAGANLDHSNYGYTALYYAVEQGDEGLARALLDAGVNPNAKTDSDGVPLISSVSYPNIMRALLDAGADPNLTNRYGENALISAMQYNSVEDVQALIDAGADVNQPDEYGQTPLQRAEFLDRPEITELFAAASANAMGQMESTEVEQESTVSPADEDTVAEDDSGTAEVVETEPMPEEQTESTVDQAESDEAVVDSEPMVEDPSQELQSALDSNPFLNRYGLGLTVVELVDGFATIELSEASDDLIKLSRSGVDLTSVDASNLGSDEDRQAVTALTKVLDSVTRKNNLEAILLVAPPISDEELARIAEVEAMAEQEAIAEQETIAAQEAMAKAEAENAARADQYKALVRQIQIELADLGYEPGPADGVAGRGTKKTIEEYQESAGLTVDGAPSDALLIHLQSSQAVPKMVAETEPVEQMSETEMQENSDQTESGEMSEEQEEVQMEEQAEVQAEEPVDDQAEEPKKKSKLKGILDKWLKRDNSEE